MCVCVRVFVWKPIPLVFQSGQKHKQKLSPSAVYMYTHILHTHAIPTGPMYVCLCVVVCLHMGGGGGGEGGREKEE